MGTTSDDTQSKEDSYADKLHQEYIRMFDLLRHDGLCLAYLVFIKIGKLRFYKLPPYLQHSDIKSRITKPENTAEVQFGRYLIVAQFGKDQDSGKATSSN